MRGVTAKNKQKRAENDFRTANNYRERKTFVFAIKEISTNMKRNKERLRLGERLLKVNCRASE